MKRLPMPDVRLTLGGNYRPHLKVSEFIATHRGDPARGPLVRMRTSEARIRLIEDGELVWISGPRRQELAVLSVDDTVPSGYVVLRDIAGVTISESVAVVKPDLDTPIGGRQVG